MSFNTSEYTAMNSDQLDDSGSLSNMHWYLAATKPRQEQRAIDNLLNQGINAYSPMANVEKISAGKKKLVTEALFPGYLFINLSPEDGLWFKVKSTRGIRDWIKFSGEVAKVPSNLVEQLISQKQESIDLLVIKKFEKGNLVRILDGPFEGLSGVYQSPNGEQRAMILIEFLGKSNRLNLANEQISLD